MKIKKEHYQHIKQSITEVVDKYGIEQVLMYKGKLESGEIKCNKPHVRLMYDLQRKAGLLDFVCKTIYGYASDSHYQTALLKAGKELRLI